MEILDEGYWAQRYDEGATGWDIGYASGPLKAYIDQLTNKDLKILIPGAGNAYEAEYLHQSGFSQVDVIDIAKAPLENLLNRCPDFPEEHLIHLDFFEHTVRYDLILEQTFFCALIPEWRQRYAEHMQKLLKPGGKLVGVLFNIPLFEDHPPFGGHETEYRKLFEAYFKIKVMETAHNSIAPRAGNELFIHLVHQKESI